MDSYMASNGSCFAVTWNAFKPPLGSRPNTKPGDHGTLNAHNCWCILFYHGWGPKWIEIHWNSIWLRDRSHIYDFTLRLRVCDHTTWIWKWLGTAFGLPQFHGHSSWLVCEMALISYILQVRPRMGIISWSPLNFVWFCRDGCTLIAIEFVSTCAKRKRK